MVIISVTRARSFLHTIEVISTGVILIHMHVVVGRWQEDPVILMPSSKWNGRERGENQTNEMNMGITTQNKTTSQTHDTAQLNLNVQTGGRAHSPSFFYDAARCVEMTYWTRHGGSLGNTKVLFLVRHEVPLRGISSYVRLQCVGTILERFVGFMRRVL